MAVSKVRGVKAVISLNRTAEVAVGNRIVQRALKLPRIGAGIDDVLTSYTIAPSGAARAVPGIAGGRWRRACVLRIDPVLKSL